MTEHVPAWKRIGLKVKQDLEEDPLAITTHLDSGKVTAKQTKQLNKKKRAAQIGDGDGTKKPPKRQKLPKSERPPPPEKDQLVYLKTYSTDRENWKFSKQKQNWILKHIKVIEDKYEEYLINYLAGLQGGSKDRLIESLKKVEESWNAAAAEDERKTTEEETKESENKEMKNDAKNDLESVDSDYAIRARKIVETITGERIKLIGIDDNEAKEQTEPEQSTKIDTAATKTDDQDVSNKSSESSSSSESSDDENSSAGESETKPSSGDEDTEKEEKLPDTSNLIVEQVEVTDFLNDEDYMDPLPAVVKPESEQPEQPQDDQDDQEEATTETSEALEQEDSSDDEDSDTEKSKKSKKDKKAKKSKDKNEKKHKKKKKKSKK